MKKKMVVLGLSVAMAVCSQVTAFAYIDVATGEKMPEYRTNFYTSDIYPSRLAFYDENGNQVGCASWNYKEDSRRPNGYVIDGQTIGVAELERGKNYKIYLQMGYLNTHQNRTLDDAKAEVFGFSTNELAMALEWYDATTTHFDMQPCTGMGGSATEAKPFRSYDSERIYFVRERYAEWMCVGYSTFVCDFTVPDTVSGESFIIARTHPDFTNNRDNLSFDDDTLPLKYIVK